MGSSKVRKIGAKPQLGSIGVLPIPDPRTWPPEIRTWYRAAIGSAGPSDVFIFDHGQVAALYLQDAVSAAAVMEIDLSEWRVERGYPAFFFHPRRIGEIQHRLGLVGYIVHVIRPVEGSAESADRTRRAAVVNITSARNQRQGADEK